jgi:hypothetical protein
MADKAKSTDHIIHGSVPKDEWEKFIKTHFKPGKAAASPAAGRAPTMGGICGSLGCPSTHPTSGTVLTGCTITTEHDGSTTITCHYAPPTARI